MINKEKRKIYNKTYTDKNLYKVFCNCGSQLQKRNLYGHIKTKKHLKYLKHFIIILN